MSNKQRFWELDAIRGFALLHMVLFHTLFDLRYFGTRNLLGIKNWPDSFFDHYSTGIAISFLTLVGVSARIRKKNFFNPLIRVFIASVVVSVASVVAHTSLPIYFGILHLITLSLLLMPLTLRWPRLFSVLGLIFVAIGFSQPNLSGVIFEWIGLAHNPLRMGDYFPIFPWLGFVWIGSGIAHFAIQSSLSFHWSERWAVRPESKALSFLGRHTLFIYILHQPLILGLLWATGLVKW